MPTQPVIEKLEKLQVELETISVAVKHIDEAAKVAKTTSEILKKIQARGVQDRVSLQRALP